MELENQLTQFMESVNQSMESENLSERALFIMQNWKRQTVLPRTFFLHERCVISYAVISVVVADFKGYIA